MMIEKRRVPFSKHATKYPHAVQISSRLLHDYYNEKKS